MPSPTDPPSNRPGRPVAAIKDGKIALVDPGEIDYEPVHHSQGWAESTHLAPLLGSMKGARAFISSKYTSGQYLPLVEKEAPLVETLDEETGDSYGKTVGEQIGLRHARVEGVVHSVTPEAIHLQTPDGKLHAHELHRHFAHGRKSFSHDRPLVAPGDVVTAGRPIAASNYVTDDGRLASGRNLRVGYLPGANSSTFEDAILISESGARKLTSEHLFSHDIDHSRGAESKKDKWISMFPNKYTNDQLAKIGPDGHALVGAKLNPGDPVLLGYEPRTLSAKDSALGNLHKVLRESYRDLSQPWKKPMEGEVVDAVKSRKGLRVNVVANIPVKAGDKLSARSGSKGVVSQVLPDHQMVHDADGNPMEILINPASVVARVNPTANYEALLGKAAEKRGAPYHLPAFGKESWRDYVEGELKANGIPDKEDLHDPVSNRRVPNVMTGKQYFLKLEHQAYCFDDQTEVLTQEGWKLWKDVTLDDEIATTDTRGHSMFFEKPLHLLSYDYEGELCHFSGEYVDYAVTPNHNLWCKVYHGAGRTFGLRQASEMHGRMFVIKQNGFEVECPGGPDQFEIEGEFFGWDDFCEFVGWWVTEGCVCGKGSGVIIYQDRVAHPDHCDRIEELINRMGLNWGYFVSEGKIKGFRIKKTSFARYFQNYGLHSQDKRLPREIIRGKLSGVRRCLESMILGDGDHKRFKAGSRDANTKFGPNTKLTSTSKELADNFSELAARLGGGSIVRQVSREGNKFKNNPHHLTAYTASYNETRPNSLVDGNRNFMGFQMLEYFGKVYCAEMRTGLLYVRRNGKPMLSGNSKESGRGEGNVDFNDQATKGGEDGAKRLGGLVSTALLSHGATSVLRDAQLHRSGKNDDMWRMIRSGNPLPASKTPFIFDKFINSLKGAGINVTRNGSKFHLKALTDTDVDAMAPHELQNTETVDRKGNPVPGGLMDHALHGGPEGLQFSKMSLDQPMPNPLFEEPIRRFLGLTQNKYRDVIAGRETLNGKSGAAAIVDAAKQVDLDEVIKNAKETIRSGRKSKRDDAVKLLHFATGFQRGDLTPEHAVITKVPVLPPAYRPVSNAGNVQLVSDPNYLYRDLHAAQTALRANRVDLPEHELADQKLAVYDAIKAVQGLGDPINPETAAKGVKGFVKTISGTGGPKSGTFLSKVVGHPVNAVGRSVIVPDGNLDMDEIGIPEKTAWKGYGSFAMGEMVRDGMPQHQAALELEKKTATAKHYLLKAMENRPLLYSRDPALHRFSIMGSRARLRSDNNIALSPLVVKPAGADFDGDACNFHIPIGLDAVEDVKKMLPSNNLLSIKNRDVQYLPTQESILGLSQLTVPDHQKPAITFPDRAAALAAYKRGEIAIDQPVQIVG